MKRRPALFHLALLASLIALSGCGGGGGSGGEPGSGAVRYPSAGAYGWILKARGATGALSFGLSLVHPSKANTEYTIEVANANVSDARLLSGGSVTTSSLQVTGLQPHSLVYIVGGDVRLLPMQANGSAPASRVQRAESTSACSFKLSANDYATPLNSRYIVSTAGPDGVCDKSSTSDDGRAEVRLTSSGGVVYSPIGGDAPLGVVRDPSTLTPRGWIYPRNVVLWTSGSGTAFEIRASSAPAITRVIADTYRSSLVEDSSQLSVFDFAGGTSYTETPLGATLTGGGGWQLIGFDANAYYVYRNASQTLPSTWTVLRITRTSPVASVLASGTGLVLVASMGSDVLFLSLFDQTANFLARIDKASGSAAYANYGLNVFPSVQTSANGVHLLWRVTDKDTSAETNAVDFINETSSTSLLNRPGGIPTVGVVEASAFSFNTSESRSRFIYASGYSVADGYKGATLETYDSATGTNRLLGALPSSADFGSDAGYASAIGGPTSLGLAFAARSVAGTVQAAGARVYSYDLGVANSLTATTVTVP